MRVRGFDDVRFLEAHRGTVQRASVGTVCYRRVMPTVYRIMSRAEWETAQKTSAFEGSSDDVRDGYIHLSARHQLAATAAKYYAGKSDLVLLYVSTELLERLSGCLRWEPSRGGDLFPHLYAPLPLSSVLKVEPLPWTEAEGHVFPLLDN